MQTEAGTEFEAEKVMLILMEIDLFGLKRCGSAWREKLTETLMFLR